MAKKDEAVRAGEGVKSSLAAVSSVRRKRRRPEEIRDRLVSAAEEEFKRSGYAGATTAAVARRADVTEAQLFRYFSSKIELFNEAIFKPMREHVAAFSEHHMSAVDAGDNIRETMRLYITEQQRFLDEHADMLMSLLVAQTYPPGIAHGVGQMDSLESYFEQTAAMMSRRLGRNPNIDPRLLVRVSFAGVLGAVLFKRLLVPQALASDDEVSAAIVDFVIDGINANTDPGSTAGGR